MSSSTKSIPKSSLLIPSVSLFKMLINSASVGLAELANVWLNAKGFKLNEILFETYSLTLIVW